MVVTLLDLDLITRWSGEARAIRDVNGEARRDSKTRLTKDDQAFTRRCIERLELVQLVLVLLAVTNFNVQIINRISSGYPLWYIRIADRLVLDINAVSQKTVPCRSGLISTRTTIRLMIMYAIVQAGLFSSFMPPA